MGQHRLLYDLVDITGRIMMPKDYNPIKISILALIVASINVSALADDWPNWRGPQYNGISNERDWGGDWENITLNVVWERVVGTGFSSITVANGRVYTMGNTGTTDDRNNYTDEDVVYCLDANTGEVLWTHSYLARLDDKNHEGGPSATPTVADGRVYTLSKRGVACCLDANDGEVVWQKDLPALYGVPWPVWFFAGSPFVDGGLVIYNVGTHGMALHAADGTPAWKNGTDQPGYASPVPFDLGGQDCVILMGKTTFAVVDINTGNVLKEHPWDNPNPAQSKVNAADPVVYGNQVFISTAYDKGSALFTVEPSGPVTEIWSSVNMEAKFNSAVLWQGFLYGPNDNGGALTCVEFSTGDIKWSKTGFGYGGLTLADGKLIALTEDGELRIVEASPEAYQEIGKGQLVPEYGSDDTWWAVPVLANGKIYARNSTSKRAKPGKLVCLELETTAPKVDAGNSCVTWLKDGTTTVDLNGTVDDDTGDVTTIQWAVIQPLRESGVVIANNAAPSTTADFVKTGVHVLRLIAIDATGQEGSDRMEVRVYADSCEAAANNPVKAYVPPLYDFDNDCIETLKDFAAFAAEEWEIGDFSEFAVFAAEWLEDESLAEDIIYDAGTITLPAE